MGKGNYASSIRKLGKSYETDLTKPNIEGVKGRPKSDYADCVWISRLHCYGFLRASFVPDGNVSALQSLWDCRGKIIDDIARYAQRINSELIKMNFRLDMVVSAPHP